MNKPTNRLNAKKNRLLIYVVAHNVQDRIIAVLESIPDSIISDFNCEVLIIDDSSEDNTFQVALNEESLNQRLKIKVLYNPLKQNYGNNLKLCFEYAIRNDFDTVVLVHGSGSYDPKYIPSLVKPIMEEKCDLVIGSRLLDRELSKKQNIPFYKRVGNKLFTSYQNKLLKTNFTDFHSGYRAYSTAALKDIPFETNAEDFLFDTQIIIQHVLAKKKITEVSIPVYSGKEIYFVNGLAYGLAGIRATHASKLHKLSIFYRREYDLTPPSEEYFLKLGYLSSHSLAIDNTDYGSNVLDIGGGQGRVARELKKKNCKVTGLDRCELDDINSYDKFYQQDLDNFKINFDIQKYDTILLLDIIEHLAFPEDFLDKLRREFGLSQPKIIITTPNIAFFIIRFQLLIGRFNYGKEGILDKTHKRLFTFKTLKRACQQCGYKVEKVIGIPAPYPKAFGLNIFGKALLSLNKFLIFFSKSLFSYQIYIEIMPTPVVKALLENTIRESKNLKAELNQTQSK